MRYHIERRVGAGGMAEVYVATALGDEGFRRRVAIKRLALGRDDASARRSFLDEARIAGALNHPGIVAVLDYGIVDGSPVQVLEWIEGLDGGRMIELGRAHGRPLPLAAALHVGREIAEALHHAHGAADPDGRPRGIVHRDVKPSNLLVTWDGHVKLADFGIAFALERSERTDTGLAKGTLAYMAPEQLRGGAVDARADVYALGCALHALITGRSAVAVGATPSERVAGLGVAIDEALPSPIASIVARATRSAPDDRYPSARAVAGAIDDALSELALPDGRRELAAWLEEIRALGGPKPGLLDDLLVLDLQMIVAGDGDGGREFTMRRGDAPTRRETPTPAAPARPRARGWRWLLLLALVAGAGVPLWLAMRGTSAPAPGVAPDATPTATAPALAIAPVDAAPEVAIRDAAAIDLAPERRDSRRPSRREPPGDDAKSPAPETPAGTGHVAIGGAELRLADIIVDGKRIGAAPRMFSLSVGAHQIEVVQPDGRRLGPISVDVTERHTRARPLRPTF